MYVKQLDGTWREVLDNDGDKELSIRVNAKDWKSYAGFRPGPELSMRMPNGSWQVVGRQVGAVAVKVVDIHGDPIPYARVFTMFRPKLHEVTADANGIAVLPRFPMYGPWHIWATFKDIFFGPFPIYEGHTIDGIHQSAFISSAQVTLSPTDPNQLAQISLNYAYGYRPNTGQSPTTYVMEYRFAGTHSLEAFVNSQAENESFVQIPSGLYYDDTNQQRRYSPGHSTGKVTVTRPSRPYSGPRRPQTMDNLDLLRPTGPRHNSSAFVECREYTPYYSSGYVEQARVDTVGNFYLPLGQMVTDFQANLNNRIALEAQTVRPEARWLQGATIQAVEVLSRAYAWEFSDEPVIVPKYRLGATFVHDKDDSGPHQYSQMLASKFLTWVPYDYPYPPEPKDVGTKLLEFTVGATAQERTARQMYAPGMLTPNSYIHFSTSVSGIPDLPNDVPDSDPTPPYYFYELVVDHVVRFHLRTGV